MIHCIYFSKKFSNFLVENEIIINALFIILKLKKKNIIVSYFFTANNPPPNPRYKYTDKLYLACILFIIKHHISWDSFIDHIPGKQVNKRHNIYQRLGR